jgi:hypothetical protein
MGASRATAFLAVVATAAAIGCHADVASPDTAVVGTYTLTSANGKPLPAEVVNTVVLGTPLVVTWHSGTLIVRSDKTWNLTVDQASVIFGASSRGPDVHAGTFVRTGDDFVFTEPGNPVVTGSLNGNALTVRVDLTDLGVPQVVTAVFLKLLPDSR